MTAGPSAGCCSGGLSTVGALARAREGGEPPHDLFHLLTDDGGH
ncbi:hypothetical protein [Streptomyces sp. NPDC047014]